MNQILSMGENPQNGQPQINEPIVKQKQEPKLESIKRANVTSNKADLAKVVRIFCICLIIFGIVLIGQSTYALISNREKLEDNVQVSQVQAGKEATITIQSGYPIKKFVYKWNDGEPVELEGDGTVSFETVIQIPNGNNMLNMTVTDYYGSESYYYKQYVYDSLDVSKPTIEVAISGTKLNIKATDDMQMSYITYAWNEEEPKRVDVEDNLKEINTSVEVAQGQNKLTITAVDKEGNKETRTENVIGDNKPTFTLAKDEEYLILTAKDDQGISRIKMTVDGVESDSGENPLNMKEVTARLPITKGTHTIEIEVTNINGLKATDKITAEI